MQKKPLILAVSALVVCAAVILAVLIRNRTPEVTLYSESCIVMDAKTGKVLFEKTPDTEREPASMTKLAALLLFFEALERGELRYDDLITPSETATGVPASKAGLIAGEAQTVETLLNTIFLVSGSDAVIALGEHLYGSQDALLDAMNQVLKDLGLEHTSFQNSVGTSQSGHFSTARDIALLSRELITRYPEVLSFSSKQAGVLYHADGTQKILYNTNKLLYIPGVTGLKTGHTELSGYCQSITYKGKKRDLIMVVMGARTEQERGLDSEALVAAFGGGS